MCCNLSFIGVDLDPDAFVQHTGFDSFRIRRKGMQTKLKRPPYVRTAKYSIVSKSITESGFDDFKGQIQEVLAFLQDNYEKLQRAREVPGVEYANLDFGIEHQMANWTRTLYLPPELLKLVGELGLSVEMSLYNDMFFRSKKKRR